MKRLQEPEGAEESCDMLTSEHAMVVAHVNSLQQWLPAQDPNKIKPGTGEMALVAKSSHCFSRKTQVSSQDSW